MSYLQDLMGEAVSGAIEVMAATLKEMTGSEQDPKALRAAYEQVAASTDLAALDQAQAAFVQQYGDEAWARQDQLARRRLQKEGT